MATGLKANNVIQGDGVSWEDHYQIDADLLTNATRTNFLVERKTNPAGGLDFASARYVGTGALTLSEFNAFPAGSDIKDFQAYKTHYKVDATTWKSSAAAT